LLTSLQIKFMIFIAIVCIITVGFGFLIMHQMKVVSKKALIAKQRQEEYQNQVDDDRTEEPKEGQNQSDDDQTQDPGE